MVLEPADLPLLMNAGAVALGIILVAVGRLLVVLNSLKRETQQRGEHVATSIKTIHEATNSRLTQLDAALTQARHDLAEARRLLAQHEDRLRRDALP